MPVTLPSSMPPSAMPPSIEKKKDDAAPIDGRPVVAQDRFEGSASAQKNGVETPRRPPPLIRQDARLDVFEDLTSEEKESLGSRGSISEDDEGSD